jgi:hypothetical protein
MKEVLSWFVRWACRGGRRDFCSALAALVGPVKNIFSSPYTSSILLSSSSSKLGRQPCWVACLLVLACVSGFRSENVIEYLRQRNRFTLCSNRRTT